jgi:ferredoxin-NADP reductase
MTMRDLQITSVVDETPTIRRIAMAAPDGGILPGYAAGAHVTITIPDVGVRKYSLVNVSTEAGATAMPRAYTLGIRLDPQSAGGSRYMHALKPGDRVQVSDPANDFPLKPAAVAPVLIGGGIGITPLIAMAAEMTASHRPYALLYAARSRTELAFLDDVARLAGPACEVHLDDAAGRVLDLEARFTALPTGTPVYMCGPKPMLKAGVQASRKLGWPPGQLMFELFYSAAPAAPPKPAVPEPVPDGSFEVQLKSSGKIYRVPPDKSIAAVLIEAGLDPLVDCQKGECGVCQVGVLEGEPDHRDVILTESERAANKVMQICISRAKSKRLLLDL